MRKLKQAIVMVVAAALLPATVLLMTAADAADPTLENELPGEKPSTQPDTEQAQPGDGTGRAAKNPKVAGELPGSG